MRDYYDELRELVRGAVECGIEPRVVYDQLPAKAKYELKELLDSFDLDIDWQDVANNLPASYRRNCYDELVNQGYHIDLEQLISDMDGYATIEGLRDGVIDGRAASCYYKTLANRRSMWTDNNQILILSDPDEWLAIEWFLSKGLSKDQLPNLLTPMVIVRNYKQLVGIGVDIDLTELSQRMSPRELQLSWLWLYQNGAKVSLSNIQGEISTGFLAAHLGEALECGYDADAAVAELSTFKRNDCICEDECTNDGVAAIVRNIGALLARVSDQAFVVQQAVHRYCSGRPLGADYYDRCFRVTYDRGIDHDEVVDAILASSYDVNEFYQILPVDDKVRLYHELVQAGAAVDLRGDVVRWAKQLEYRSSGDLNWLARLYEGCLENGVTIWVSDWLIPLQKMQKAMARSYNQMLGSDEVGKYVKTALRLCPDINIYYLVKLIPWSGVIRDNLELLHGYGANANFLATQMTSADVVEKVFQLLSMGADTDVVVKCASISRLVDSYGYASWISRGVNASVVIPCIDDIVEELPSLTVGCGISVAQVVKILLTDEPGALKVADNARIFAERGADINDVVQAMLPPQKYRSMPWLLSYDQLDVATVVDGLPSIDMLDFTKSQIYSGVDMNKIWRECLPELSQRYPDRERLLSKFAAVYLVVHWRDLTESGYEVTASVLNDALRRLNQVVREDGGSLLWWRIGDRRCTVDTVFDTINAGADPDLIVQLVPSKTLTHAQLRRLVQAGADQVKLCKRLLQL